MCKAAFAIVHLGNDACSGHCKIRLSTPGRLLGLAAQAWNFIIRDDNVAPSRATSRDTQLIAENGYIIGALRRMICLRVCVVVRHGARHVATQRE